MTTEQRLQTALAAMCPGGVEEVGRIPAIAMPMHMGLDGTSVALNHGGQSLFAKSFHDGALAPFTFAGAADAAQRAGAAGLGPRLIAADATTQVLLFDHLGPDWRMALAPQLQTGALREATVLAKRHWHRSPALVATLSPFDLLQILADRLSPGLGQGTLIWKGAIPLPAFLDWMARIALALAASGADLCPVHGENTASNVMIGPGDRVLLVDFDRAVMADPWWDLGALSLDLCRTEEERAALVEIYAGRADPALLARLKLYALVDDLVWALWALLADEDPATAGPELYKYANNRLVRLVHHMDRFDLGALLGKV